MEQMKTLTLSGNSYEIVDEYARNAILELQNSGGGSGGSTLSPNFYVIAYSTEEQLAQSAPPDNTLGVITETAIAKTVFSYAAPVNPIEGELWIKTAGSGTEIVTLKTDAAEFGAIHAAYAQQYTGGAWVGKTVKIYRAGAWAEMWDGVLYDAGNEYVHITGGWYGGNASTSSTASSTITKNDDHILIKNVTSASNAAITTETIDLTHFNTLNVLYKGGTAGLRISPSFPTSSPTATNNTTSSVSEKTTLTLDISTITGRYQCALSARSTSSVYLYKMWLE